jgi:glycosyltransferase involved in cell wall biosynthesis
MRTLIVSHFYPPEVGAAQGRLSSLAREWTSNGDAVTVLTGFPNHPTGVIPDRYRRKVRMQETVDGVRVVRTWLYATPNEGSLRRILSHLSFMVSSVALGMRLTGPQDVVIVSSPTFFSIFAAWLIARIKRARFVVEVRDLWPAFAVELGLLRNPLLIRLLERAELASYRASDAVVVVTRGFRGRIVGRGIRSDKVHVMPNGVEVDRFTGTGTDRDETRASLGAGPDTLLAVYAGAHGMSYALTAMADVAADLRREPVHFLFVGDGPAKEALAERVRELGLDNVTLLPSVPRDRIPGIFAAADVCLLPDRDLNFLDSVVRAKIFEYMAAGKPVVASARGETADILREAGQLVVQPLDGAGIAQALRGLIEDPGAGEQIGCRGRSYVAGRFDLASIASAYRELLVTITGR